MFKFRFLIFAAFVFCASPAWNADNAGKILNAGKAFTQKDLARMIVTEFGWEDGLPKEPADRDYLVILNGRRNFRFEAENAYNFNTDKVVLAEYNLYGPFSGKGWLRGVSEKTSVTFTVMIPIGGEYTLKAALCGNDFIWKVGDKEYRAGSGGNFKEVVIGVVKLKPGVLQIKVSMPPMGGIDTFSFVAPDNRPIQPFAGWRFKEPLVAERLAEVAVSLLNLYDQLPEDTRDLPGSVAAVDAAKPTPDAMPSTIAYLGSFSSRAWLRADHRGAALQIPLKAAQTGYYALRARVMGQNIEGDVNGYSFSVGGKPYLDTLKLGLFRLDSGDNMLTLKLPPMGGVDVIEFRRKRTTSADFMLLAGLSGAPERPVSLDEAQKFIKAIHAVRK